MSLDASAAFDAWARVSYAMLAEVPLEEFLDLIAQTAATLTGHPFAAVMLLDEDETRLIAKGAAGLTRDYVERLNTELPVIVGGDAPASRAFRTGEPVIVHMTEESLGQWADLAREQGYESIASVPLATAAGQIGALNVYAIQRAEFSRSQVTLLKALATDAAAAIQIVQLRASEHQKIAELEQSDLMYQALNNVALTDEGLDPITRALSSMTGRRIAIEELVTESMLSAHPAERPSGTQFDELRARILASTEIGVGDFPSTHEAGSEMGGVLSLVPVALGSDVVAHLWAFGDGGMTPLQQRVLERGAVVVALELLNERHAREVEWRMRGDLLEDLLTVTEDDEARVLERARGFGHDFTVPHVMIVVRPDAVGPEAEDQTSLDRAEPVLQRIVSATQAVAGGLSTTP